MNLVVHQTSLDLICITVMRAFPLCRDVGCCEDKVERALATMSFDEIKQLVKRGGYRSTQDADMIKPDFDKISQLGLFGADADNIVALPKNSAKSPTPRTPCTPHSSLLDSPPRKLAPGGVDERHIPAFPTCADESLLNDERSYRLDCWESPFSPGPRRDMCPGGGVTSDAALVNFGPCPRAECVLRYLEPDATGEEPAVAALHAEEDDLFRSVPNFNTIASSTDGLSVERVQSTPSPPPWSQVAPSPISSKLSQISMESERPPRKCNPTLPANIMGALAIQRGLDYDDEDLDGFHEVGTLDDIYEHSI